jgi:type I restriction enzyme S subunit
MSEWKEYNLGEIINIKHGYAFRGEYFSETPTLDILLTPGNFNIGGGFKQGKLKYYSGDYPISYILNEGDIIVTMTDLSKEGDTLGYSAKIPKHNEIRYLHNQRIGRLQFINNEFSKDYIYWILRSRDYQKFIINSATGSTVKHTSPSRISEYRFTAPDLPTQIIISEILSSLDDKIELNNKINQELENLAQTLFKKWFIDFEFPNENGEPYKSSGGEMVESELGEIPMGWGISIIEKELDLIIDYRGKTPLKLGFNWVEEGVVAISAKNVKNRRVYNLNNVHIGSEELYNVWMKEKLQYGDVLLTSEAPLGEVAILLKNTKYILSQRLFALRSGENINPFYLFEWFCSDVGRNELQKRASGSTVLGIQQKELRKIDFIVPQKNVLNNYATVVKEQHEFIEKNNIENQELSILRDTLLPKLISGELEINENNN